MDERCSASNKDGGQCNARPWRDGVCQWHHPDRQAAIAEGRRKGGAAKSNRNRARKQFAAADLSLIEVRGLLSHALRGVLEEDGLEPNRATAAASLARAIAAVTETADLENRIVALEEAASRRLGA